MQQVLYILGELIDDDVDWILKVGQRQELPAGEILIQEGIPAAALFLVLEGSLGVSVAGVKHEVARLVTGDIVGEMSFIDSRPPSATVKTLEPCLLLTLAHEKLAERLKLDTGFASRFYRALAVLLSNRLRGTVRVMGRRANQPDDIEFHDQMEEKDLSQDMSDNVAIAKVRFDWLLRRLKTGQI